MPPPPATTGSAHNREFHGDVDTDVRGLRRRLAAIVEQVCGGSPRAQDITDRFGIYRKLGWQIWNVLYVEEPLAAIKYLPSPRAMKVFLTAAGGRGVGEELIQRLADAIGQFRSSVQTHADNDREMLEMLVENHSDAQDEAAAARSRKQAFTGNAFTWGVRAKCMFACAVVFPSPTRNTYWDMVRIQGLVGLVRTRANVRWPFAQLLIRDAGGKPFHFAREPLDFSAAVKRTGVPLFEEFCSKPLPDVLRKPGAMAGMVEDELQPGEVGAAGAANIITAERLRGVAPIWADKPDETVSFGTGVRTPCELFISDLIVHRSMYAGATRELFVFGELMTQLSRDDRDRLPVPETVQRLGPVSDGIATADVPRHTELLHDAFNRAGLAVEEFDAYRVRMRYPPLPVSVIVRHAMPMRRTPSPGTPEEGRGEGSA